MSDTEPLMKVASSGRTPDGWMACATLFELLSLGLLTPERPLAEAACEGELASACAETLKALGCDAAAAVVNEQLMVYTGESEDAVFHQILREHTRLFVGTRVPPITPYAGVRAAQSRGQRGLLFVGPESMAIERFMKRCGVAKDLAAGQSNDPVDHVGTMCEFLKFLCLVNARAVAPVEGAHVEADDFDRFMAERFAPYATWCAGRIRELSAVPFYLAMADMLDVAVAVAE